jgi:2-polyprenyl-6-methoxyphenol hydroxylase-like FAD-dependent oxidoreductase
MPSHVDVLIVGAGLAGCALAQSLALADQQRRRRVLLVDVHRGCSPRFSGEFIHPRGAEVLDDLGFYRPLSAAGAVDVVGFVVLDGATGPRVDLDYDSISGQRPLGISVHHKTLVRTLRAALGERGQIDLREGWRVVDLVRSGEAIAGAVLRAPDGTTHVVEADLVVGADGKASAVRKLAGMPDDRRKLGFTAGVEIVDAASPARFAASVVVGPPGPILVYPIEWRDGHLVSRVTFDFPHDLPVKRPGLADHILRAYVPHLPARLAQQVAEVVLRDRDALELAPTFELPAPPATAPGLALIGDAAGCSHPITASGMTMGLLDAKLLGDQARRRADAPEGEPWLDARSLRRLPSTIVMCPRDKRSRRRSTRPFAASGSARAASSALSSGTGGAHRRTGAARSHCSPVRRDAPRCFSASTCARPATSAGRR